MGTELHRCGVCRTCPVRRLLCVCSVEALRGRHAPRVPRSSAGSVARGNGKNDAAGGMVARQGIQKIPRLARCVCGRKKTGQKWWRAARDSDQVYNQQSGCRAYVRHAAQANSTYAARENGKRQRVRVRLPARWRMLLNHIKPVGVVREGLHGKCHVM